jgi:MRG
MRDTPLHRQNFEKQLQEAESQRQAGREAQKQEQLRKQKRQKEGLAKASTQGTDVVLPFTLKTVMVDEREKINRCGFDAPYGYDNLDDDAANKESGPPRSVHALPAAVTIRQLLKHFEKKARKQWQQKQQKEQQKSTGAQAEKDSNNNKLAAMKQEIRQFCKSLGRVFEKALPVCLLYPQERPQYEYYIAQHDDVSALDIYGCEFLLRLLVRLPHLMPTGKPAPPLLAELTLLLQQNRPACFKGKFRPPNYPHEWLEWEKKHYGNSKKYTKGVGTPAKKRQEKAGDISEDGLFT